MNAGEGKLTLKFFAAWFLGSCCNECCKMYIHPATNIAFEVMEGALMSTGQTLSLPTELLLFLPILLFGAPKPFF